MNNFRKNARTTVYSRNLLVKMVREQGVSVKKAASVAEYQTRTTCKGLGRERQGRRRGSP
jgi:hypothetical protein